MVKKGVSLLFAVVIALNVFIPMSVNASASYERIQITYDGQCVDEFNGVKALYKTGTGNTNTGEYSCAGYVTKYFRQVYGFSVSNLLQGATPQTDNSQYSFSQTSSPQSGDVCYHQNSSGGGHWMIIKSVSGNSVTVIEQNWKWASNGSTYAAKNRTFTTSDYNNVKFFHLNGANSDDYANLGDDFYAPILIKNAWKPLLNFNGSLLLGGSDTGKSDEMWRFQRQSDGSYTISSCVDGKRIDVNNASSASGTRVQLCTSNNSDAQKWYIYMYDGGWVLRPKCSQCVLDLPDANATAGNGVQIWTRNNSVAQTWAIYRGDECQLKATTCSVNVGTSATKTTFTWNEVFGETGYDVKIWKNQLFDGDAYHVEWGATSGYGIQLPAGTYQAYVDVSHYYQCIRSNVLTFTVPEATYTVTFNANGGSTPTASKTVTYNSTYGTLPTPTRTGYTFNGWFTAASGGAQITSSTKVAITSSQTLYAQWTQKSYNLYVRLDGGTWNGSTENKIFSMKYGETKDIPNPTKEGYTFVAWDFDTSTVDHKLEPYGRPVFSDPIFGYASNLSVYNNKDNGAVTIERVENSNFYSGSGYIMKITTNGTARPGLGGFVRTYNSKSGGVFYHVISAKIPVGYYIQRASNSCGDGARHEWLTSQAGTGKWETYVYKTTCGTTGTFSSLGHVFISKNLSYLSEETATSPVTWYVGCSQIFDATGVSTSGKKFTMGSGTAILYARYKANSYTLHIRPAGGTYYNTSGGHKEETTYTRQYSQSTDIGTATRDGYNFICWAIIGKGTIEPWGTPVSDKNPQFTEKEPLSLYNNNSNDAVNIEMVSRESECPTTSAYMMKITTNGTAKPGLGGFADFTNSKSGGVFYHILLAKIPKGYYLHKISNPCGDGAKQEWITSNIGTGNWETYIYKTTCGTTGNFGTFGHVYISKYSSAADSLQQEIASSPVTWYVGYSNVLDATGVNQSGSAFTYGAGDAYLHAMWKASDYTVTFNANGGNTSTASKIITYDSTYETLPIPTRAGHTFLGWFTAANSGEQITSDTKVTIADNQTLYAHWEYIPPHTETQVVKNGTSYDLSISQTNLETAKIIVAGYKNNKVLDIKILNGNSITPITFTGDFDEFKVMVWENLSSLKPLCEAEIIPQNKWIIE